MAHNPSTCGASEGEMEMYKGFKTVTHCSEELSREHPPYDNMRVKRDSSRAKPAANLR